MPLRDSESFRYLGIKKTPREGGLRNVKGVSMRPLFLHKVLDRNATVVLVGRTSKATQTSASTLSEGVSNQTITSFKSDVRLKCVSGNAADHLQGHVRAIEETSVISVGALITGNIVLSVRNVSRIGVDVDLQFAVDGTSEQVAGVVDVQVSVQSRGVVKYTCH